MNPTLTALGAACALLCAPLAALAQAAGQQPPAINTWQGVFGLDSVSGQRCIVGATSTCQMPVPGASPSDPSFEANSAAFQGETAMTVGATGYAAGRSLKLLCPSDTTLSVAYADGVSTGQWAVAGSAYSQTLPIAITAITAVTTPCSVYANLK